MKQKQKQNNTEYKEKIIIDTDPGHDDALAIMMLALSKEFDIKAITTVAGNSTIKNVTNNVRYILDLIESDIPIYSGSGKPIKRKLVQADVHGTSGLDGAKITRKEKCNEKAVEKIIEIVKSNPNEISIVVLGPETNIAKAFLLEPELPKLIKRLVIMGGAIDCPGNKNRVAEFNIFVDPESAKIVFDSNAKKVLVPLDVCNDVVLTEKDFKKLKGSKLYKPVIAMMKKYIKGIEKFEGVKGALVYDALAGYYLINSSAYKTEPREIRIETKGELTRGMTVTERRGYIKQSKNVELVKSIKKEVFVSDFIKMLKSL